MVRDPSAGIGPCCVPWCYFKLRPLDDTPVVLHDIRRRPRLEIDCETEEGFCDDIVE